MTAITPDRPYLCSVGDEPLPGYRLVAPLGQGGFGEVWKCLAPGGLQKAIKFVLAEAGEAEEDTSLYQEYEAFQRVKGIRHPFLLTLERVELIRDELIMVMELADESLHQQLAGRQAVGYAGLDRRRLLAYMVDIAEALDVLSGEHGLQHLDVKPANLLLLGGHVKVGDYGLVARYRSGGDGAEPKLGRGLTPKYVAPEILSERVDGRSDQYSLALVYAELLTGRFPYSGKTSQQLLLQHTSAEPDLSALPESDREAVAVALSKSPADRFPTCLGFVKALLSDGPGSTGTVGASTVTSLSSVHRTAAPSGGSATRTPLPSSSRGSSSGASALATTQRGNPATLLRSASASPAADELAAACPTYRFLGEGKSGPRGRLVRAADPTGVSKAVRLMHLDGGSAADLDELFRALAQPLPGARQQVFTPQPRLLAVVWDADVLTLREWIAAHHFTPPSQATAAGLLAPLGAALDGLHAATGFGHLLLAPSAVLVAEQVATAVTGFGVGEALRRSRTGTDWIADHPYAAPEALAGRGGPASDQYSLALMYLELRRVWSPDAPRARDGLRVAWDALAKEEQAAVRQALDPDPAERFPTCAAFLDAVRPVAGVVVLDKVRLLEWVGRLNGTGEPPAPPPELMTYTKAVLSLAQGGQAGVTQLPQTSAVLPPVIRQGDGQYSLRFPIKLSGQLARLKLTAYTAQEGYKELHLGEGVLLKPKSGRGSVELFVALPPDGPVTVTEMTVCGRLRSIDQGPKAVEQVTAALDHFRRAIQNAEERRTNNRWRADLPVSLYPVDDELAVGLPIRARTRDVSASGFAVAVTGTPPTGHLFIAFEASGPADGWAALARVVRTAPLDGGDHLIAGRFTFAGS